MMGGPAGKNSCKLQGAGVLSCLTLQTLTIPMSSAIENLNANEIGHGIANLGLRTCQPNAGGRERTIRFCAQLYLEIQMFIFIYLHSPCSAFLFLIERQD